MTAHSRSRVVGVDFSGAADAGRRIWLACGSVEDGTLRIETCFPAADLPGSGPALDPALRALIGFLAEQRDAVVGLDFPFSLAAAVLPEPSWEGFVLGFPQRYPTPASFRDACALTTGGKEIKRSTDRVARVPFAAHNIRLFRQTHAGIGAVLQPLLREGRASVLPMQAPAAERTWLIEICPASTLKAASLYGSYKGRSVAAAIARERILVGLCADLGVAVPDTVIRTALQDQGGDALDSIIAAVAVARTLQEGRLGRGPADEVEALEGRVYF